MTQPTVTVKVNVINEMKKLRSMTYADRLAWVDELVQNAQRAGANDIRVAVSSDSVDFRDNGCGCTDPQVLFEKSTTGWGKDVESQNPFGEGFFSTMMVANHIRVKSTGFIADFNIRKMFEEETLDCITVMKTNKRYGFRVILTDLEDNYDPFEVADRFQSVMQYLPIRCYLDGKRLERVKFTNTEDRKFALPIKTERMEGWIAPYAYGEGDYDLSDRVRIFANYREVCDLWHTGVKGIVHVPDGVLDLRSPDRKDIIGNEKKTAFVEELKGHIKATLLAVVINGGDKDINQFAFAIDRHLDMDDYVEHLKFVTYGSEDYYTLYGKDTPDVNAVEISEDIDLREVLGEFRTTPVYTKGGKLGRGKVRDSDFTKPQRIGSGLPTSVAFYVSVDEMEEYEEQVKLAHYHNVTVIVARNILESKVLTDRGFVHIKNFEEKVSLAACLRNTEAADDIELRANWLFSSLSKALGKDRNIFRIGDLEVTMHKRLLEDIPVETKVVHALAIRHGDEIFIDRRALQKQGLKASDSKRIQEKDKRFFCTNITVISHELAHLLCDTVDNTQEHAEAQIQITSQIMNWLF